MTHLPWTSISTRSSSGARTPRPSTRHSEAIFASSHLPSSADRAFPKITSAYTLFSIGTRSGASFYLPSMVVIRLLVSNQTRCPPLLSSWTRKRARRRRDLLTRGDGRATDQRRYPFLRKGWVHLLIRPLLRHRFLTLCITFGRSPPNPHQTSKKYATSTTRPSSSSWKR